MSGRLIILRHKSWHVWNQDNQEKVLRDERLHREAEEAKVEDEKRKLREQSYEALVGVDSKSNSHGNSSSSSDSVKPFRLFEDLETKAHKDILTGNAEYLKEKKEKELKQKKSEGIADWALGDGSVESKKIKPWYEKPIYNTSNTSGYVIPKDLSTVIEKKRKSESDPMEMFMNKDSYSLIKRQISNNHSNELRSINSCDNSYYGNKDEGNYRRTVSSSNDDNDKKHMKQKKQKKHKKEKDEKDCREDKKMKKINKSDKKEKHKNVDNMSKQKNITITSTDTDTSYSQYQNEYSNIHSRSYNPKRYSQQYNPQYSRN